MKRIFTIGCFYGNTNFFCLISHSHAYWVKVAVMVKPPIVSVCQVFRAKHRGTGLSLYKFRTSLKHTGK